MEGWSHRKPDSIHGDAATDIHGLDGETFRCQVLCYLVDGNRLLLQLQGHAQMVCMGVRHRNDVRFNRERAPRDKRIDQDCPRPFKAKTCMAKPGQSHGEEIDLLTKKCSAGERGSGVQNSPISIASAASMASLRPSFATLRVICSERSRSSITSLIRSRYGSRDVSSCCSIT